MNKKIRICDITVKNIQAGKNWFVVNPDELIEVEDALNMEDVHISERDTFKEGDTIVYSGILVTDTGKVTPLVLIKQISDLEYGGDYCEFQNGQWKQVGLEPNPNTASVTEYFANPLSIDPSFGTQGNENNEILSYHREGFRKWSNRLQEC